MQIVLCDNDVFMREMVESVVRTTGHEIHGIADTTHDAVGLIEAGHPQAVVVDLSVGYNTDFDVIAAANAVGARAIVFTHNADAELLARYEIAPAVIPKPDLVALEDLLRRLGLDEEEHAVEQDRRARPARAS